MTELSPIEIDPKRFLRDHFTLPALPEVVTRIQGLIHADNVRLAEIAELISGEPALVAQVLKVANSAYYGLPREIGDVKSALAFLGLNEIYRMVLSLSVVNTMAISERDELNEFWFHSFFTALCTKYLAKRYEPHISFEELWSAAILHDIGKLVYLKFFPDHYKTLKRYCAESGCLFSEAERDFSWPESSFLGALLCDHWRLPDHVKEACETHTLKDLPEIDGTSSSARFRRMVSVGNVLAVLSADELKETTKHEIISVTRTVLGCTEPEFLVIMGDIYELTVKAERFSEKFD